MIVEIELSFPELIINTTWPGSSWSSSERQDWDRQRLEEDLFLVGDSGPITDITEEDLVITESGRPGTWCGGLELYY